MKKGPMDRTKVVLRHLPPTISPSQLLEQIDGVFSGRYNLVSFRFGKNSLKQQSYSRAYIDFKRPEDVIEFAEFFDGHVFVNEKGNQYKTIVEYAPSQRVPKQWLKKDGREGTIVKDSEYLEFIELISKPVENLPSAEIQLERREAERAGAAKAPFIVTPLMDFIRQKRAAKMGSRRTVSNGKSSRRAVGSLAVNSSATTPKRGSEKKRTSSTMRYFSKDVAKDTNAQDKPAYILIAKRDDQQLLDKSIPSFAGSEVEVSKENSGVFITTDTGKKVLLLKGIAKESSYVSNGISQRQNQRGEPNGRIIRSILLNKDVRPNRSLVTQFEQKIQGINLEEKRLPRPPHSQIALKNANGGGLEEGQGNFSEKHEKCKRKKERSNNGKWTVRRSDGSHASDESLSSYTSQPTQISFESMEGSYSDMKLDILSARNVKGSGGRNGSYKHIGRRRSIYGVKDIDGSLMINEVRSKR